ncbi:L,D-transpeptidase family protein [Micromonosporaceae bacterium Da 78-11]
MYERRIAAVGALLAATGVAWGLGTPDTRFGSAAAVPTVAPSSVAPRPPDVVRPPAVVLPAVKAPKDLPVITYRHVPHGFPADPDPSSTAIIADGLRPSTELAVYDAPGGRPRAFLPPSISGVEVTVPIVARQAGWVAVLLPSVNRRIGWLPARGWSHRRLRDQLVVRLGAHELIWLRDGARRVSWTVATGSRRTPTPPGRTFVLGPTATGGAAYAGLDALVLGAVPDDRDTLSAALRDGHTAIHGWYRPSAFGHSVSNGCVRIPAAAQRTLLRHIPAGTTVHVID